MLVLRLNKVSTAVEHSYYGAAIICPMVQKGEPENVVNYHPTNQTTVAREVFEQSSVSLVP